MFAGEPPLERRTHMAVSEPLNPSEQPEKGGRNAVLTVWGVIALLALAGIAVTLLIGRRPVASPDIAASTMTGPQGTASSPPNAQPAASAAPALEPSALPTPRNAAP